MTTTLESIPQQPQRVKDYWGDRPMGEVRAKVRLTNAFDAVRFEQGQIDEDAVRQYEADALIDTGAVATVIPPFVADALGVGIRKQRVTQYADGRKDVVGVTNPLFVAVLGRDTVEECLVLGDEVLIGQTVLEKTDLLVDCANAKLVPNPEHPDQPVSKIR